MQYRLDTQSQNKLSILGFGCMRFPKSMAKIDALIMKAITGGVNYFDTAYIYSGSEAALGTVLAQNKARGNVYLASKLPLLLIRSKADFDKYFTQQLERLQTTYIDYYLMHMLTDTASWDALVGLGIEEWIAEKKAAGSIRRLGFSFHGAQTEFFSLLDRYPWEFCQIQYNYSDRNFQAGYAGLQKAAQTMSVMIMEPLLGGRLAHALSPEAALLFKKARPQLSPAAWGLNWVWNHPEVTLLLSGMSTEAQLEENLRLADTALPGMLAADDLAVYTRVIASIKKSFKIPCTGCNYCMPCPKGVNIPGSFSGYNLSYSLGYAQGMKHYITSIAATSTQTGSARNCVQCGKCEKHCPQSLPIIQNLVKVRRRMEPLLMRMILGIVRGFLGRKRGLTRVNGT
ncbi:aldo/keto reductase [Breznakiellaceae bacterium SP9]